MHDTHTHIHVSVPARLGKGQGAKEIGHNLVRESKFGHNSVRDRHIAQFWHSGVGTV